jgi:cytosine deaminase
MNFTELPEVPRLTLKNVTVPACLLGLPGDLVTTDLNIEAGRIATEPGDPVDMRRAMVFPAFIDVHTHLDKGHIQPRCPNPDGTSGEALTATAADRAQRWDARDVGRRMDFALRSAWAHGTRAIRTHLDSVAPQHRVSFGVFRERRAEWAGRIELQAVNLCGIDQVTDRRAFDEIADEVAASGGVLGAVVRPNRELRSWLRFFFAAAARRGLAADLHVDESGDASVATLGEVAQTVLDTGFDAPVMVGHCCSLALQPEPEALSTLDLVARAGLHVVSLPMCNLYLQDRVPGRTPRWRGITLVHEMKARGIAVSFASDNTRDPFYAYGDLDMLEVMREATRIAHLDHSDPDWIHAFLTNPAAAAGFAVPSFAVGAPADLVICNARNWNELFARPQADRIVMRDGRPIRRRLPAYAELDDLMARE